MLRESDDVGYDVLHPGDASTHAGPIYAAI